MKKLLLKNKFMSVRTSIKAQGHKDTLSVIILDSMRRISGRKPEAQAAPEVFRRVQG